MSVSKRFLPPIPNGCQIFWSDVEVAGVQYVRSDVASFIRGRDNDIEIELEKHNAEDRNAIAVHGISRGWFCRRRRKIGFIPAEIARTIAEQDLFFEIQPRIRNLYLADTGFCIVRLDLVGPKTKHDALREGLAKKHVDSAIQDGGFVIPRSNLDKNRLGESCERTGDVEKAVMCYEACIRNAFDGNYPYDRLIVIYKKRKNQRQEIRVIKKAIKVFEKVAKSGRSDGERKLRKYRERLAKIEASEK